MCSAGTLMVSGKKVGLCPETEYIILATTSIRHGVGRIHVLRAGNGMWFRI